jgi:hypothetical protein
MEEAIHFKTSIFDVSKEEENPINPIYGKSLLVWLRNQLKDKVDITEPQAEDWGWYSELEWEGSGYLIGSAVFYEDGDDPRSELEWVFQIHKYRSFKDKLFGKNKMSKSDGCFLFFKALFEKEPKIRDIEIG